MKRVIFSLLILLSISSQSFGASEAVTLDLTQNSDMASQTTGTDSPYFDTGVTAPYEAEDVIFGYGSKHSLTFKKDGRILGGDGKEIENDKDLIKQLRNALNGICPN